MKDLKFMQLRVKFLHKNVYAHFTVSLLVNMQITL